MKIIGIGNLVTDYYYKDGEFIGACGGMTAFNIIANLSSKFETYAVGICGNDRDGKIAIKSLKDLNVNTDYIIASEKQTRCFNINIKKDGVSSRKKCPICDRKKWYDNSTKNILLPKNLHTQDGTIVIFDTLNEENMKLAIEAKENNCTNVIDIGRGEILENLSRNEITEMLRGKFDFVQLNERVAKFLIEKFSLDDTKELNSFFSAKMIIITYGKKGAEFIYDNKNYLYNMENPSDELDPTGAGDLFFSVVIEYIIKNEFNINKRLLNKIYKEATLKTSQLVGMIGARALIQTLYKVQHEPGKCICGLELEGTMQIRKKVKKISSNVSNLNKRIKSDFSSNAYTKVEKMINNLKGNTIFCGTGGSYAASYFASRVVNTTKGIWTEANLPRDIIYKNIKDIKNIIAFSYSGTTNDIVETLNYGKDKNRYLITKGNIVNNELEVISYLNSKSKTGKERGFLSIEGTIFPASLFAKYYFNLEEQEQNFEDFIQDRLIYWRDYFKKYFRENDMKTILSNKSILDVFYGDYTNTAAIDLESKIVETGIYRATFHEKKNFSHGRFISLEHYKPNAVIYLQTDDNIKYEKKLLEYLESKACNLILIKTPFNGLIGEFDLLLAMQYFIKSIADVLDVDLSKPDYSEESMDIYKYKGVLN